MSAVLSRDDMLVTRNFLRWAGLGVQPSRENAVSVLEVIKPLNPQAINMIRRVADEIARGVIVSQDVCKGAERQLSEVFESADDNERHRGEIHHG